MKLGGRIQAAIEVLTDITQRHTPATDALRDWGKANRYAGSKDRSFIGNVVHDALRRKSSLAYMMGDDSPRAIVLGTVVHSWDMEVAEIEAAFDGDKFSPKDLTDDERAALTHPQLLAAADEWVRADVPEWLWPAFENNFDDEAVAEGQAMCARAPLDLRVNTLTTTREAMLTALAAHGVEPTPIAATGLRIPAPGPQGRLPNIQIEKEYQLGQVEIQDEASQIASRLIDPQPGEIVLDLCAGGGGKTLALAALMKNEGQLHAFDVDKRRLSPIFERLRRAGVQNVTVHSPGENTLDALKGKVDRVVVDAPCSGAGTWRRKPDAKWRLSEQALDLRLSEQAKVLRQAAEYVRPGGYLIYMTCSVIAEENESQIYKFIEENKAFTLISAGELWEDVFGVDAAKPWSADGCSLTMSPASTGTDGFFFSIMEYMPEGTPE
ncbi:RsmB/NOP family class I SAM-dependent RNA methyltransferase [Robiginitomaculum antarcticum]|uniref:RsmB/NOP family class I SAM-dependent RNA methyltransferase n=1 Tax=Robiginitomaculum antarcticum TaxID=437507 RepID=UPI00037CE576|nr:RsmB/NOP family class I SAM-dependent RNA methyltransferase [Robiginitomaculum antarcticum]